VTWDIRGLSIEQALPQASGAFKSDSNGLWWIAAGLAVIRSLSMPTEQILTLLLAGRDRLNRAIEALQGPIKSRGRPPNNPFAVTTPAAWTGEKKDTPFLYHVPSGQSRDAIYIANDSDASAYDLHFDELQVADCVV
jgi:hypothetical protein